MCTLIVSFQQHAGAPLVIAANRDELRGRPASEPSRWGSHGFIAPRDEQAGGTWLGLTRAGMFVGVTNRYPSERLTDRESRGALVVEALEAQSAGALHTQLAKLSPKRFNTFHLLYADREAAYVTWSDGEEVHHSVLPAGLHVVTERSLGGDDHSRTQLVERAWPTLPTDEHDVPTAGGLQALLATRVNDPAGSVCVDLPDFNYGTRSSLVLFVAPELSASRWYWADGRPDRTPFVERPELIAELTR